MRYKKRQRGQGIVKVNGVWHRDYAHPYFKGKNGKAKRIQTSLRTSDKTVAERIVAEELRQAQLVAAGVIKDRPKKTLAELFREYEHHKERTSRPNTVQQLRSTLRLFAGFLDGDTPGWREMQVADVTIEPFKRWQAARLDAGRKPCTINTQIGALKGALSYAVRNGYIEQSPIGGGKLAALRVEQDPPRYLSRDEIKAMRWVLADHQDAYDFFVIAINSGIRLGAILHLTWEDSVFLRGKIIRVVPHGGWHPKTRTSVRNLDMRPEVSTVLARRYMKRSGSFVFGGQHPLSDETVKGWFRKAYRKAGIEGAGIQTLRHTFASHLVMNGVPLLTVSRLLGHASVKTTERYAHLSPGHLKDAMNAVSFCDEFVKVTEPKRVSLEVART
jgi:integrase